MIKPYPNTPEGEAQIAAVKEPKNIWINSGEIIVSTGEHYVPPPVPVVSMRAFRFALTDMGWRQEVDDFLKTAPAKVRDSFETAGRVARYDPMVLGAIAALGKTEAQADELFAVAQQIEASL